MLLKEFANVIRAKHPGSYDQVDDKTLVDKWLIKYPQYKDRLDDPNYRLPPQAADWYPAGAEKPVEQKLAENAVDVGNAAGMGFSIPGMVEGAAGLGAKALGAVTEGLSGPAERAANWFGSRTLQFAKSTLPESATKAGTMVDEATEYAMNPHPEVQEAIRQIGTKPAAAAETSTSLVVPPSETSIALDGPKALPAGPAAAADAAPVADAMSGADGLNDPILSMSNLTPKSQLAATEQQLSTVGGAIERTLTELNETGHLYDPKSTVEQLAGMYQRNASGQIIPGGSGSQQALYNQAVSRAIETVKANALDSNGILQKLDWTQANGIKKALQDLSEYGMKDNDPVNQVYQMAAHTVRNTIDDQAQAVLAAQGRDVSHFQTLRNAYSKLKGVQSALNNKVLSEMSQKNVAPVVRTMAGVGGLATGHPGLAAVALGDYVARAFGPLAMARGLKSVAGLPAKLAQGGADLMSGTEGASSAARGIAAGLVQNDDEDR